MSSARLEKQVEELETKLKEKKAQISREKRKERGGQLVALGIMLTSKRSEQSKISGFAHGADDYLTKPFSPRELTMRVKSVLKRSRPSENTIRLEHEIVLHLDRRTVTKNGVEIKLTPNEYSILLCLANNAKALVSRDKLVEHINSPDALDRTVDVHGYKNDKHRNRPARHLFCRRVFLGGRRILFENSRRA